MSKILKVTPNDDYTLLLEFEHGNKIIFNMRDIIKTIPFSSLQDLNRFGHHGGKTAGPSRYRRDSIIPLRLTVDNICLPYD